ncbi:MAG: hypothetical protein AAB515_00090 [Patescibacteria group bacterium]
MRVEYTLTLLGAVVEGRRHDKVEIRWQEPRVSRDSYNILPAWIATREYVLRNMPDVTALDAADLHIHFA